ncbi:intracellular short-chain-length polyhydroxyalkanoate depolymerase [Thermoflavimicrobium dichotomicum]|uniref:Pimeloyl-ACP methyl ester carboxylesterase n=1 Tax=Thermoflavimicrobium dichotomicum TaxID=46223 RepID=A0A1I3RZ32_9BACL|nr:alpha/beta hydrolase [Thermoflavimicrobium dichotomicum]SFJ51725.1 Pimeloyl-ACP methyl ester carboxylesterase [Thermoflavimicrobium dichotomicum]
MSTKIVKRTISLANGETLGYREREGGEQTLLLIHGNMTSSQHWDVLMERIDPKYRLIAIDLRGFGLSTYHQPIQSLKDFAQDIKLLVDRLKLRKFAMMGWSLGGGVAMQFAADYPEYVEKCILLCSMSTRGYPFYQFDETGKPMKRLQTKEEIAQDPLRSIPISRAYQERDKSFLRQLWNALIYTQRQPSPEKYEIYLDDMCTQRNLVDVYHALNHFNISKTPNELGNGTGEVEKIQAPVLILWGENDLVVTKPMTMELIEDLGEKAKVVSLQNCGHSPLIDDLEQLVKHVKSFLED